MVLFKCRVTWSFVDLCVIRLVQQIIEYSYQESNAELYRATLDTLRILIRTSTSSMTSAPKPLKFLRPHYIDLQALYETWSPSEDKVSSSASLNIFDVWQDSRVFSPTSSPCLQWHILTHNLEGPCIIVCCPPPFVHRALLLQTLALGAMNMSVTLLQSLAKSTQFGRMIP